MSIINMQPSEARMIRDSIMRPKAWYSISAILVSERQANQQAKAIASFWVTQGLPRIERSVKDPWLTNGSHRSLPIQHLCRGEGAG